MADQKRTTTGATKGLAYGLLIGWATGMFWWASVVVIFGLEPAVVTVITDSTGRHETQVTVWERIALVPFRAMPWAVIAGVVGAIIGSGRRESHRENDERPAVESPRVWRMGYSPDQSPECLHLHPWGLHLDREATCTSMVA